MASEKQYAALGFGGGGERGQDAIHTVPRTAALHHLTGVLVVVLCNWRITYLSSFISPDGVNATIFGGKTFPVFLFLT